MFDATRINKCNIFRKQLTCFSTIDLSINALKATNALPCCNSKDFLLLLYHKFKRKMAGKTFTMRNCKETKPDLFFFLTLLIYILLSCILFEISLEKAFLWGCIQILIYFSGKALNKLAKIHTKGEKWITSFFLNYSLGYANSIFIYLLCKFVVRDSQWALYIFLFIQCAFSFLNPFLFYGFHDAPLPRRRSFLKTSLPARLFLMPKGRFCPHQYRAVSYRRILSGSERRRQRTELV